MASANADVTINLDRETRRALATVLAQQAEIIALLREQMGLPAAAARGRVLGFGSPDGITEVTIREGEPPEYRVHGREGNGE